jgi:ribosome-associated heat shock protein Hsp15
MGGERPLMTDRQRVDRWMWHARIVRTRSAAAELALAGHVRLNGVRIEAASRAVRPGDVLTIALDRAVRVLRVEGFAERRGGAEDARGLYSDLTQDSAPPTDAASEEPKAAGQHKDGA